MERINNTQPKIVKKIIYAGKQFIPIRKGTKVHFHFQTWQLGKERILLDDSRKIGKKEPVTLVIGHKFKLEVWENVVQMMSVGEVASFTVNKELVYSYPLISKTLRELGSDKQVRQHTCTMTLQTEGIGFKDLDILMKEPCDLEFIIELVKVENPDEYEHELWQLSDEERLSLIPQLRQNGNMLYKEGKYTEAEQCYSKAIGICEQLIIKERPGDDEWHTIQKMKMPILLNYAQCRLIAGDYYSVIEHCNTILDYDKDNEKALYRRGRAHVGAWNPDKAEEDFNRLKTLNGSISGMVDRELANLEKIRKQKQSDDKKRLKNMFDGLNI